MARPKSKVLPLNEVFEYDESSPSCIRRLVGTHAGEPGNQLPNGYWRLSYNGKSYLAHHLVLILHGKKVPDGRRVVVDHIDQNPSNNKLTNLRVVSKSGNALNSKVEQRNTSGHKGVSFVKRDGKWRAFIKVDGKFISEYCESKEMAIQRSIDLRREHGTVKQIF